MRDGSSRSVHRPEALDVISVWSQGQAGSWNVAPGDRGGDQVQQDGAARMGDVVSAVGGAGASSAAAEAADPDSPAAAAAPTLGGKPADTPPNRATMRRWAVNVARWIPTQSEWLAAAATVQPEEKERIGRFVFATDAKLAMAGRLLIRRACRDVLGCSNTDLVLARTKERKPFLDRPR